MAGFDFRPPEFSEDIAWLPAWLQPHQVLFSGEQAKDAPCENATSLQENVSDVPAEHLVSKGDPRCSSFHLFLSGDSHSPVENTPSSGNVLHFDLHLSSDDILQHPLSQPHGVLQKEKPKSEDDQPVQSIHKASAVQDDIGCRYKLDNHTCAAAMMQPSSAPEPSPTSPLQPLTIVELSIAASEALAISDLMKSGLPDDILSATAILEVALRVKQARKECCLDESGNGSTSLDDDDNENDHLSNLDESNMEDAFEDVGLSVSQVVATPDDLCDRCQRTSLLDYQIHRLDTDSSYVPNTLFPESLDLVQNTEDRDVDSIGVHSQIKLSDVSLMKLRSNDSLLKSPNVQRMEPRDDELFLGSVASTIERQACANQPAHNAGNDLALTQVSFRDDMMVKGVDFDVEGVTLLCTQSNMVSSPCIWDSRKDSENAVNDLVTERFRSRWFGGWTAKDFDVTAQGSGKAKKSIPKLFTRETSFLSESVDVVMDESSMQKPEIEPKGVAPSISVEGIHRNTDTLICLSQELVGSSNLSLPDPLCSVVPCSISLDNAHVSQAAHQKSFEEEGGRAFNSMTVPNAGPTIPSVSFSCGEEHLTSKTSGEGLNVTRKISSSLKIYSMVVSARYGGPEGEHLYRNEAAMLECAAQKINTSKPTLEATPEKMTSTDIENDDVEVQGHQCEESCSPFILNYGTRRRICDCDIVVSDTEESLNQASLSCARKTQSDNCRSEVTFREQANFTTFAQFNSSSHSHLHDKESRRNKRVHFVETEVKYNQSNAGQKLPTRYLTRSHNRTSKKVRDSGLRSKFGVKKENRKYGRGMLFHGLDFLLTGFSSRKTKELETQIRKHGGTILFDVPTPSPCSRRNTESRCKYQQLPIVLSPKKVQTTKFLYGCAINTLLLKSSWLTDSILAGCKSPPGKYLILSNQATDRERIRIGQLVPCNSYYIFDKVGIMFYGKPSFCSKLGKIVKHGGGQVFKTLQWLVQSLKSGKNSIGAVVVEDEGRVSRHLRHFASEQRLQMMPASWIINSLHSGKLLPFKDSLSAPLHTNTMPELPAAVDMSEEI
ncbi:hypothetical protein MRB53_009741 [Persea americana]|uniref:Uncharacterized protein n=1 Tax=Persea americana TaxID=3435 RepID=A0ACC2LR12_PERAE|nr:hypothetical protein MRB53_009741 [Persea americana]